MLFDEEYYESLYDGKEPENQKLVSNPVRAHFQTVAKLLPVEATEEEEGNNDDDK
ncbi:hypothetical protein [Lelliottia wanjuensis]|uniref:hypothetical protein n=1 Tax=Lelliottia wanjuensis TaxID=3050585 RepID=UPI00254F770A|nr:hypothetical protein [Lelliottia sp. V86_10]MDK9585871.1 hypothetical protein [Lelliottia sp. V86_10]